MKVRDIKIGDVLQSPTYGHHVRVLSLPRKMEDSWVVDAIHITGKNMGYTATSYHVGIINMNESSMVFITSTFLPIKKLTKLTF